MFPLSPIATLTALTVKSSTTKKHVSKRNMEEFSVVIMKRFRSNWFEKTKRRHVTYNTRQSVLRRKRIQASFVKSKIPKIFEGIDAINISNILNGKES
jgi:hypothetical protein